VITEDMSRSGWESDLSRAYAWRARKNSARDCQRGEVGELMTVDRPGCLKRLERICWSRTYCSLDMG
jgi:hypothetical protein